MGKRKKITEPIKNSSFYSIFVSSTNTNKILKTPSEDEFNKNLKDLSSKKEESNKQ